MTRRMALLVMMACGLPRLDAGEVDRHGLVSDFFNVAAPIGADPWVWKHTDGWYYATLSTSSNVTLLRSRTISGLGGAERKVIYRPPAEMKELWAPEIHLIGGRWYVYFAADDGDNANHRMYVLENPAADPFQGEFLLKGKIADPVQDRWAIDGTVFSVENQLYFVWSGWEGTRNVAQNLYIARMGNPWTLIGPRVLISRPTFPWEQRGGPPTINEGPEILIKAGQVHLIYSASGSWTDHYQLGRLSARVGDDLLAAGSWKKHPEPVFESANGVFGPGHGSFTRSPDGREDWLVYHSARRSGSGWTRLVRAQPFGWHPDGTPDFGKPVLPDRPIPLPGGEPARIRVEAESATLTGLAKVASHSSGSGGRKVGQLDSEQSSATLSATVAKGGSFLLVVRFGNGTADNGRASHRLTVNDGAPLHVSYENNGWDNWSNAFVAIVLKGGENRLRFERGEGFAEIDCIDLIPQP